MLCEKCKKNEAKINLVKIVNGEKHEIWLCEDCAKNITNIPFLSSFAEEANFPFQSILTGILSNVPIAKVDENNLVCHSCGLTYKEFKKTGKMGCANCYKEFGQLLESLIQSTQGKIKHIGRIPKISGKEFSRRRKLKDLKLELQKLIVTEEYEKAAIVRDVYFLNLYKYNLSLSEKDETKTKKEEKCNEQLDS
ncbi:hypothetical protein [Clostridium saccharobutylicum]|uniref:hypothetical protein n=1 Tax=Clostridium saccharobutylicum TaxID=169679 RepID=UPI0007DFEFA5|nr:hypothetical protein [Clostridium saccharobutylicum]OAV40407.1 hypothetical protein M945_2153 [Clostridium saccharobutylicum DSM 13864]